MPTPEEKILTTAALLKITGVPHRRALYEWVKKGIISPPKKVLPKGNILPVLSWDPAVIEVCKARVEARRNGQRNLSHLRMGAKPPPKPTVVTVIAPELVRENEQLKQENAELRKKTNLLSAWIFLKNMTTAPLARETAWSTGASETQLNSIQEKYALSCRIDREGHVRVDSVPRKIQDKARAGT